MEIQELRMCLSSKDLQWLDRVPRKWASRSFWVLVTLPWGNHLVLQLCQNLWICYHTCSWLWFRVLTLTLRWTGSETPSAAAQGGFSTALTSVMWVAPVKLERYLKASLLMEILSSGLPPISFLGCELHIVFPCIGLKTNGISCLGSLQNSWLYLGPVLAE